MRLTFEKLTELTKHLAGAIYRDAIPLTGWRIVDNLDYGTPLPPDDDPAWQPLPEGGAWGGRLRWAWMKTSATIPADFAGKPVALRIQFEPLRKTPETQVFSPPEALVEISGIDTPPQTIDQIHHDILLAESAPGDTPLEIVLDMFSGSSQEAGHRVRFRRAEMVWIDREAEALYFDANVLLDSIAAMPESASARGTLLRTLDEAFAALDWRNLFDEAFSDGVRAARKHLRNCVYEAGNSGDPRVPRPRIHALGHAHIDVEWLWPLDVTRGKAERTFSTALMLMERFPGYTFTQSQPQLYKLLSQTRPDIYERVKARVREGRLNPTGGTWVEPDTNLPSGEALVRQFLFGMRYFERELGVRPEVLWLPDVFGYTAALPQIMRLAGVRYFYTSKLSWNQYTDYPYDTFWWEGLDGSRVLTQLATTPEVLNPAPGQNTRMTTYNARMQPLEIVRTWERYKQKAYNHHLLIAYGLGDGGGGPSPEMVERAARMADLPGMPQVQFGTAEDFFHALENTVPDDLPRWVGELYFQLHRGTFTSQSRTKRYNRKTETLLHSAEALCTLAHLLGAEYPQDALNAAWEIVLLRDGGGGPSPEMVERAARMADLPGMPQVQFGTAEDFFHALENTVPDDLPRWVGELYFQLHRGTFTSQSRTKRYNRKTETLLHSAEALCTLAHLLGAEYPQDALNAAWEIVLLRDGGGGPSPEMVERAARMADLPGMPQVQFGTAEDFFHALENTVPDDLPRWVGELYFQLHRGTFTSQSRTKRYNRKTETLLHSAEALCTLAHLLGAEYPQDALNAAWEIVLLHQFHDILPGSSIREVYEEVEARYERAQDLANGALDDALDTVAGQIGGEGTGFAVFNTLGATLGGPVELELPGDGPVEVVAPDGTRLPIQWVDEEARHALILPDRMPAYGYRCYTVAPAQGEPAPVAQPVEASAGALDNGLIRAEFDAQGRLVRVFDREHGRDVLAEGAVGNQLWAYVDRPHQWDAWDVEAYVEDQGWQVEPSAVRLVEAGPLRGTLEVEYAFNQSRIVQRISLLAGQRALTFETDVDWREQHILLKAEFPLNIRATDATYEIQFGTVQRPTHENTPWDQARHEVPAQQWADLSEAGYGVALLNDCKYGYSARDNVLKLSLLRSPMYPDPLADQGAHTFTYALLPHAGDWRNGVIEQARRLNYPLFVQPVGAGGSLPAEFSLVTCDAPSAQIDTIKRAEDSADLIVRVYEAHGGRTSAALRFAAPIASAEEVNLLEEPLGEVEFAGDTLHFALTPYQIRSFRVALGGLA